RRPDGPGLRPDYREEATSVLKFRPFLPAAALLLAACSNTASQPGDVTEARLLAAEEDGDNWLSHGRTYAEQRFSPLTDINADNVGQLSLAWAVEFDTNRGQEATPVVVDGIMYLT